MSRYIEYDNKIAFHPGYYILKMIINGSHTLNEFAHGLDISREEAKQIVDGERDISMQDAISLAKITGMSTNYWINLQTTYNRMISISKQNMDTE